MEADCWEYLGIDGQIMVKNGSCRNIIRIEWFHLAHGRCLWQDHVNSVKKRWVSYDAENSVVTVKVLVYESEFTGLN